MQDPRYIKIDERPLLTIYRPTDFPDPKKSLRKLRDLAQSHGFPDLHINVVEAFGLTDPRGIGADSLLEFPPHGLAEHSRTSDPVAISTSFSGAVFDYEAAVDHCIKKDCKPFTYLRGVMPSWDNTARRGDAASLFVKTSIHAYSRWLRSSLAWSRENDSPILFINAWNEWGEGAHLEPDLKNRTAFLEATKAAKCAQLDDLKTSQIHTKANPLGLQEAPASTTALASRESKHAQRDGVFTLGNAMTAISLLRREPRLSSLVTIFRALRTSLSARGDIFEADNSIPPKGSQTHNLAVGVIFHVYYEDQISDMIRRLDFFPQDTRFMITTPKSEIFQFLSHLDDPRLDVVQVKNQGRNFGPLFVEFSSKLLALDVVFHLHSKKSTHMRNGHGHIWRNQLWDGLAGSRAIVENHISKLASSNDSAILYLSNESFVPKSSMGWHSNRELAAAWLASQQTDMPEDPIEFPAGGMMVFKPYAILELLTFDWGYENFQEENGQLDGTMAHTVERLIGTVPSVKGYSHLVHDPVSAGYTKYWRSDRDRT